MITQADELIQLRGSLCNSQRNSPQQSASTVLESAEGGFAVYQSGDLRWLSFGGEAIQAVMDVNHPARVQMPYVRALLLARFFLAPEVLQSADILNLGMGGASLERFLAQHYSETKIDSVEVNAPLIKAVAEYFGVPSAANVFADDALVFLENAEKSKQQYALIFSDIFHGSGVSNTGLLLEQDDYFRALKQALAPQGCLALNLLPENQQELKAVLIILRRYFSLTVALEIPGFQNVIVFAMDAVGQISQADIAENLTAEKISKRHQAAFAQLNTQQQADYLPAFQQEQQWLQSMLWLPLA